MSNTINPNNLTLGTCNGTNIVVDIGNVANFITTATVVLGAYDYVLGGAYTGVGAPYYASGVPTEPCLTGVSQAELSHPGLHVSAGSTVTLFSGTAAALVLGGFATYH